ncbi:MAG: hypothetical protein V1916_01805, partial [Patescibacteria group bacterium]
MKKLDFTSIARRLQFGLSRFYWVVLVVLVVGILASGYFAVISSKVEKITQVNDVDLQQKRVTKEAKERALQSLRDLQLRYETVTTDQLTQLEAVLP